MHIISIIAILFCTVALGDDDRFEDPLDVSTQESFPLWPYNSVQTIQWSVDWSIVTLYLMQEYQFPNGSSNYDIIFSKFI